MQFPYDLNYDNFSYRHHKDENFATRYTQHSHEGYEFVYVLSGDVTYKVRDKQYRCTAGDLIVTKPLEYHNLDIKADAPYERLIIQFDATLCQIDNVSLLDENADVYHCSDNVTVQNILQNLDYFSQNFDGANFAKIFSLSLQQLIFALSAHKQKQVTTTYNQTLTCAVRYVDEHLTKIQNLSQVAKACFVTENYLYKIFVTNLKTTPQQYVTLKRLALAKQMLQQGLKPSQVFCKVGFCDYSTFFRSYVKYFNRKPSQDCK